MKTLTIAGGGIAGLALGIALRGRSIPVRVFEAAAFPRHRVCTRDRGFARSRQAVPGDGMV